MGRKFNTVLLVLTLAAAKASIASGDVILGPIQYPANGHYFYLLSQDSWTNSEAEAVEMGGQLATITDSTENAFIYNTFSGGGTRNLWLGLYDPTQDSEGGSHASNFVWESGAPVDYTNWAPGEPNNFGFNDVPEYYGMMWGNSSDIALNLAVRSPGTWNDIANSGVYPYPVTVSGEFGVVEVDNLPEPSLGLLGLFSCILVNLRPRSMTSHQGVVDSIYIRLNSAQYLTRWNKIFNIVKNGVTGPNSA
jgi:hypothetical protein